MKNKYSVGDNVVISKIFVRKLWGKFVGCKAKTAIIVEIKPTITFGPSYVLEINGERLPVCYWEDDINGLALDNTDYLCKARGNY